MSSHVLLHFVTKFIINFTETLSKSQELRRYEQNDNHKKNLYEHEQRKKKTFVFDTIGVHIMLWCCGKEKRSIHCTHFPHQLFTESKKKLQSWYDFSKKKLFDTKLSLKISFQGDYQSSKRMEQRKRT